MQLDTNDVDVVLNVRPGLNVAFHTQISHVPNLICELNACEVRRLNQLNSADLN